MPTSVCLPPLEFCRGVSPSQAAKSRPDLNTLGSGVEAVITEAISLPTPGTLASQRFCRREGIVQNLYYRWSKDFLEAGKKRLAGDTARAATSNEVKDLRREASALKEVVAELTLENRLLKKSVTADGEDAA